MMYKREHQLTSKSRKTSRMSGLRFERFLVRPRTV